jgi:hypothetical protein
MEIQWRLDELGEEQLIDPYGDFLIARAENAIGEQGTFLYEWFVGLIEGIESVRAGSSFSALVNEPSELSFRPDRGGMCIRYYDKEVVVDDLVECEGILRKAAKDFLRALHSIGGPEKNVFLDQIKQYAGEGRRQMT